MASIHTKKLGDGADSAVRGRRKVGCRAKQPAGGRNLDYTPHTEDDVRAMLATVGAESIEELFSPIPSSVRLQRDLALPGPLTDAGGGALLGGPAPPHRPS